MNRKSRLNSKRKTISYLFTLAIFFVVLMANTGHKVQADGFNGPGPNPDFVCSAPFGGTIICYPKACQTNPLSIPCRTFSVKSLIPGNPF